MTNPTHFNGSPTATLPALPFLRRVLFADALVSGITGLLMLLGAGMLQDLLGIPAVLLRWAGLSLIPFALIVAALARRRSIARAGVWAIILLNFAWTGGSILLLASGWIEPNGLGQAFILVQAFAVVAFAEMQYMGLRKSA